MLKLNSQDDGEIEVLFSLIFTFQRDGSQILEKGIPEL